MSFVLDDASVEFLIDFLLFEIVVEVHVWRQEVEEGLSEDMDERFWAA